MPRGVTGAWPVAAFELRKAPDFAFKTHRAAGQLGFVDLLRRNLRAAGTVEVQCRTTRCDSDGEAGASRSLRATRRSASSTQTNSAGQVRELQLRSCTAALPAAHARPARS